MMGWFLAMLVCLGISVAIGYAVAGSSESSGAGFGAFLIIALILCFVVSMVFSVKIIQPGQAGVQMAFGSFSGDPLPNGTHLIKPWAQVVNYSTKVQQYTMDHGTEEGQKKGDEVGLDAQIAEGTATKKIGGGK